MSKLFLNIDLPGLKLLKRGKVREVFDIGDNLLFVVSDRISAFDVIMSQTVPDKGKILNSISAFWFKNTKHIIDNHFITDDINQYPDDLKEFGDLISQRSMIVKKAEVFPVECVVRGYLAGSGWKEYKQSRTVCGIPLPDGLIEYSKLPEPIFTPATKAETGHDENIDFEAMAAIVGQNNAIQLRDVSIKLYKEASEYMEIRGIILADTKFEFGIDETGSIILIDEALTPDSSRFWLKEYYAPGITQVNFDKQVLRDWLETLDWNKQPPPPDLPDVIINKTLEKYKEAYKRITESDWN
jgi:phosphoribosylaminoimidazole-succinocarboxamide synthase